MNKPDPLKGLTYEERTALPVIRRMLKRKPETAALFMHDMSKEAAQNVLVTARDELGALLKVSHAFSSAAAELVKIDEVKPCE